MQVGIISDIHDNIWALEVALQRLQGCQALICLGDLCAPFTLEAIAQGSEGPVHLVWGNNDGDKLLLTRVADKAGNVTLHGEVAELQFGGRQVAASHYDKVARAMARSGDYNLACYGHTHKRSVERQDGVTLLNPGEVMGRFGVRSLAIYDTQADAVEVIEF